MELEAVLEAVEGEVVEFFCFEEGEDLAVASA